MHPILIPYLEMHAQIYDSLFDPPLPSTNTSLSSGVQNKSGSKSLRATHTTHHAKANPFAIPHHNHNETIKPLPLIPSALA
jgi:hypothetical protein